MLRTILKLAVLAALIFIAYKAAWFYSVYKFATYTSECVDVSNMCRLAKRKASDQEVATVIADAYSCIKRKQPFHESLFFPVPRKFIDATPGSTTYKDAEAFCKL